MRRRRTGFMDFAFSQYLVVAVAAFGAQILGGVAGYGTGLIMPLVLVPLIGAGATVPVIALSALMTNPTRAFVFRDRIDARAVVIVAVCALPGVILGAIGFAALSGRGAQILIGVVLLVMVPLGRLMRRGAFRLSDRGLGLAASGYGALMGATSGSGVIMLALLLARGLSGAGVIATDAAASTVLGIAKTGTFLGAGSLPPRLWGLALLIGIMATPGTLAGRWIVARFSPRIHDGLLDLSVLGGGLILLAGGLRGQ